MFIDCIDMSGRAFPAVRASPVPSAPPMRDRHRHKQFHAVIADRRTIRSRWPGRAPGYGVGALPGGGAACCSIWRASSAFPPTKRKRSIARAPGRPAAAVAMATPDGVLANCVGPVVNGNDDPGVRVP